MLLDDPHIEADLARRSGADLTDADRHGPVSPSAPRTSSTPPAPRPPQGRTRPSRNVVRLFAAAGRALRLRADDVWTLFSTSYAFDFSVWEIWGACCTRPGRRRAARRQPLPARVPGTAAPRGVTVLNQTPSAFEQLVDADLERDWGHGRLRNVVLGGEPCARRGCAPGPTGTAWTARRW
ncbi:hypothetical protein GCM10023238_30000 [Streptomyces heliomycini]